MAEFILLLHVLRVWVQIGIGIALAVALPLAALAWMERTRRLDPFGAAARWARTLLDPPLRPIERLMARFGQPRSRAPWWGVLAVLLVGALLLGVMDFVRSTLAYAYSAGSQGPTGVVRLLVSWGFSILQLAVMVRVITSWIGGHYTWVGRVAMRLTEWFLAPLRRVLPTFGMVDLSPLVAWFALSLLRGVVLGALGG
jgi:YggT family protein